jgi:release factor glutamine methyltransferase
MTTAEAVHQTAISLKAAGFNDFTWQARVLVAHTVSSEPGQLPLLNDKLLDQTARKRLNTLLDMRLSGVPLQHVTGEWDFYGRTYLVDGRALVPRPETELLVEFIVSSDLPSKPRIADIGTGSGIIGISLALEIHGSSVTGTDISTDALELANENRLLLDARNYSTVNCSLLDDLHGTFHVIAANLPYISSGEIPLLDTVVKDYDPVSALDGGPDGTLLILELVEGAPDKLKAGGLIALETGFDQEEAVCSFFKESIWEDVRGHRDLAGKHRMVTARRR